MKARLIPAACAALALIVPARAPAAEIQFVAQGQGTTTYYSASSSITCPGTLNVVFRLSGPDFAITESWIVPPPNPSGSVETQAICAVNKSVTIIEADNKIPAARQCIQQATPAGSIDLGGVGFGPYTMSGNGSALNPYVFQWNTTTCGGVKVLDKITLRTVLPMSYKHEYSSNGFVEMRSTGPLVRVA